MLRLVERQLTSFPLRRWNLRNVTLQQECYLTNTRDYFRQHSTFAQLYNAAASPASRLRSVGSLAMISLTDFQPLSTSVILSSDINISHQQSRFYRQIYHSVHASKVSKEFHCIKYSRTLHHKLPALVRTIFVEPRFNIEGKMTRVIKRRRFLYLLSFIAVARFPTFLELTFPHLRISLDLIPESYS